MLERQLQGDLVEQDYRVVRPDGSVRWIRNRSFPIRDGAGQVCRVVGFAEDVTERQRAGRRLAAQHAATQVLAEFETFADAAPPILQKICESISWDTVFSIITLERLGV